MALRVPPDEFAAMKVAKKISDDMNLDLAAPWTPEQEAEFRERLAEAAARPAMLLPPRWPTPAELRSFLAENVTVVAPGETLIIRAYEDWTPSQCRDYQIYLNEQFDSRFLPFRVLLVFGAELGVVRADGDE